jgi:hypothetical protein
MGSLYDDTPTTVDAADILLALTNPPGHAHRIMHVTSLNTTNSLLSLYDMFCGLSQDPTQRSISRCGATSEYRKYDLSHTMHVLRRPMSDQHEPGYLHEGHPQALLSAHRSTSIHPTS